MAKARCVDCGTELGPRVKKQHEGRCRPCAEKAGKSSAGVVREQGKGYRVIREGVGVRELKANPGELLAALEETPELEIIITRYGKPSAKLVSLMGKTKEIPWSERVSLRNTWKDLPEPSDADFADAKEIWEPRADV